MKKSIFYLMLLSFVFASILYSCNETTTPVQDAVKMSKAEIESSIGYEWFAPEWNIYKPDTSIISQIKAVFDTTNEKFYIFLSPSCGCKGVAKTSAELVKVLETSNISENNFEMYSMSGIDSKHPYMNIIKLHTIPSAYYIKNGQPVYSILDTFTYYQNIANIRTIEKIVLDAITNY